MKAKILFSLSALVLMNACTNQPQSPQITDVAYNPSTDSLYLACKNLKGVANFIIGKSTIRQVMKDKDYLANNPFSILRDDNNLHNGHWGCSFLNTSDYDKMNWIKKESKGRIKQLHPQNLDYKMGDIIFDDFDMAFLDDTLVAIYFKPSRDNKDLIFEHYKEKYGNGRGSYYKYHLDNEPQEDRDKLFSDNTERANIVWENEDIALSYEMYEHFKMGPNIPLEFNSKREYLIYSKKRYPVFETELKALGKTYDDMKKAEKESTLNNL